MRQAEIDGFGGNYKITDDGNIISVFRQGSPGCVMKQQIMKNGYHKVWLKYKGVKKGMYVHRLVAEHFIPNPYNKPCVNHRDGNKDNNCAENLEWVTYAENMRHAVILGLNVIPKLSGENHPTHKLKEKDIHAIKKMFIDGIPVSKISNEFKISNSYVYKIIKGIAWRNTGGELPRK